MTAPAALVRLAALALAVLAAPAHGQDLPALFRVTGVAAGDMLNVRAGPDAGAAAIGALAPDATGVEVVELAGTGGWGRVNLPESSGWVAMRHLAAEPGPAWHAPGRPLACYGTEPFWSLALDGAGMMLERMGEDPVPLVREVTSPPFGDPPAVGFSLAAPAAGFGIIRAEACSDGMSDRRMGLSLNLFLGPDHHAGCCTLGR